LNKTLLVFAGPYAPVLQRWAIIDGASFVVDSSGEGAPCAGTEFDRCILILPGTLVGTVFVTLPKRLTAQVKAALPLLLKDQLAAADSKPHCVIGGQGKEGRLVGVVEEDYFGHICNQLREIGLTPDLAVADYMLLSVGENQMVLVDDRDATYVLKANGRGFSAETSMLPALLSKAMDSDTTEIIWHGDISAESSKVFENQALTFTPYPKMDEASLCAMFAKSAAKYSGINFMEGAFAKRSLNKISWPKWRRTLALATAASFLIVAWVAVEAGRLNARAEALDAEVSLSMAQRVPGVRNLSHLRAKLRELRQQKQDGFLALSNSVFLALQSVEYVSLEQLDYNDQTKQLLVHVNAKSLDAVHFLRDQLAQNPDVTVSLTRAPETKGSGLLAVLSLRAQA